MSESGKTPEMADLISLGETPEDVEDARDLTKGAGLLTTMRLARGDQEGAQRWGAVATKASEAVPQTELGPEEREDLQDALEATESLATIKATSGDEQAAKAWTGQADQYRERLASDGKRKITLDLEAAKQGAQSAEEMLNNIKSQIENQGGRLPYYDPQTGKKLKPAEMIDLLAQRYHIDFAQVQEERKQRIIKDAEFAQKNRLVPSGPTTIITDEDGVRIKATSNANAPGEHIVVDNTNKAKPKAMPKKVSAAAETDDNEPSEVNESKQSESEAASAIAYSSVARLYEQNIQKPLDELINNPNRATHEELSELRKMVSQLKEARDLVAPESAEQVQALVDEANNKLSQISNYMNSHFM